MTDQEGSSGFALNKQEEIELTSQTAYVNDEVGGVPDTIQILLNCEKKGQKLFNQPSPLIYRVPSSLRDINPSSYEPKVVSIGPLHKEDKALHEFEEQKATYLHHLLRRSGLPLMQILDACLQRVNAKIHKIRECYGGMKTNINDVELAKMMVMDACFILEFLFQLDEDGDLISGNIILTHSILRDLVLLENQIPFFVLQDIFDCTLGIQPSIISNPTSYLTSLVRACANFGNPFKVKENNVVDTTPHHILGLLQSSFHPTDEHAEPERTCPSSPIHNHSALELDMAGVKFKLNENENWPLAIGFSSTWFESFSWCWGNSTLRMPVMHIDDNSELILRNIIAYEQCTPEVPNYVTSYACAIDFLVDTTEDLSRLIKSKVLTNDLGSNEDAIKMINNIAKGVVFKEFYYLDQWDELNKYYNGRWAKNIARWKRKYFNSPWSFIALLAGIILFALTIIQTIYTMEGK